MNVRGKSDGCRDGPSRLTNPATGRDPKPPWLRDICRRQSGRPKVTSEEPHPASSSAVERPGIVPAIRAERRPVPAGITNLVEMSKQGCGSEVDIMGVARYGGTRYSEAMQ